MLDSGGRETGGKPDDPNKRDPLDFVLWQPSAPDEPAWQSRWGPGRPGWHIECSALAMRELGDSIDLHGGGRDLIFPHHECEAAQSESVTGQTFCRHWFHVGMVGLDGTKMSKSLGNLVFVGDLLKEWDPIPCHRWLLLGTTTGPTGSGKRPHCDGPPSVSNGGGRRVTAAVASMRCGVVSMTISTPPAPWPLWTKWRPPGWGCRRGPLSWALLCEFRLIAEVCARRHDHRGNPRCQA